MAAREAVTAAAWATAEKQYADHSIKVSDIAKSLGLTSIELSNTAKDLGWPLRSATRVKSGATKRSCVAQKSTSPSPLGERAGVRGLLSGSSKITAPSSGLRPPSPQGEKEAAPRGAASSAKRSRNAPQKNPIALVQRVYATIDGELGKLEKQEGKTSQDRERASRALSQITNSLEKAVEMQRDIKKAMTKASGRHDKEALAHAEDLRRAIAERLERLQRQRSLGKRSGGAD